MTVLISGSPAALGLVAALEPGQVVGLVLGAGVLIVILLAIRRHFANKRIFAMGETDECPLCESTEVSLDEGGHRCEACGYDEAAVRRAGGARLIDLFRDLKTGTHAMQVAVRQLNEVRGVAAWTPHVGARKVDSAVVENLEGLLMEALSFLQHAVTAPASDDADVAEVVEACQAWVERYQAGTSALQLLNLKPEAVDEIVADYAGLADLSRKRILARG